ncbi:MAG: hypothetical protein IPJ98_08680 [Bryobacterales bacterium]|nr:hypothetical protein [Bryobacterales bacterium]
MRGLAGERVERSEEGVLKVGDAVAAAAEDLNERGVGKGAQRDGGGDAASGEALLDRGELTFFDAAFHARVEDLR